MAASASYDAVLVWSPPGEPDITVAENDAFLAELGESAGPCGARVRALMEALDEHHPSDLPAHCHVLFAAVRPEARGSGVRAAVSGSLRELRRRDDVGVYAEASSTRSLRLWERLGYERIGREITLPEGGPTLYPIFAGPPAR